ncbi:MAG: RodZ domain-containing protein [Pseudomonadota bacterium]
MSDGGEIILRGFDAYEVKLGDDLRGERASRGKSLLDVQRELKIKAAYIDAIENCDATVFPNRGYVAGYVRAYARYLGRDAEDVYAKFCAESGFEGVHSALSDPRGRQRRMRAAQNTAPPREQDEMLRRARFLPASAPSFSLAALSGLGSVMVLCGVVAALGYGGWYLLRDIQRIGFEPVAQAPTVIDLATLPAPPRATPDDQATTLPPVPNGLALQDLYAPRLDAPKVEPRDGPIAAIDPDAYGAFAPAPESPIAQASQMRMRSAPDDAPVAASSEPAITRRLPESVAIVARDDAWVRVFLEDGTVVFERILKPNETYEVPEALEGAMLRAGNAGAVYLRVGDQVFGPLGDGANVARRVALSANEITASWPRSSDAAFTAKIIARSAQLPGAE